MKALRFALVSVISFSTLNPAIAQDCIGSTTTTGGCVLLGTADVTRLGRGDTPNFQKVVQPAPKWAQNFGAGLVNFFTTKKPANTDTAAGEPAPVRVVYTASRIGSQTPAPVAADDDLPLVSRETAAVTPPALPATMKPAAPTINIDVPTFVPAPQEPVVAAIARPTDELRAEVDKGILPATTKHPLQDAAEKAEETIAIAKDAGSSPNFCTQVANFEGGIGGANCLNLVRPVYNFEGGGQANFQDYNGIHFVQNEPVQGIEYLEADPTAGARTGEMHQADLASVSGSEYKDGINPTSEMPTEDNCGKLYNLMSGNNGCNRGLQHVAEDFTD